MVANLFSALILCLTFLSDHAKGNCPLDRWGQDCRRRCSSRCVGRWCLASSGKCKLGCADRFYGDRCDQHCGKCRGFGRCYRDGRCIYGCLAGWTGSTCLSRTPCQDSYLSCRLPWVQCDEPGVRDSCKKTCGACDSYPETDCGQPTAITNMVVTRRPTYYGDQATYRCVSGYTGVGSGTSTCQENGNWTRPGLICTKIDCGQPSAITNMVVTRRHTFYGDQATYRCVSGYTGVGSGTSTCQEDGSWTRPDLSCEKIPCQDDYFFCHKYFVNCDEPGKSESCKKTCGACADTYSDPCEDPERWGWHCRDLCNAACSGRRCDRLTGQCLGDCIDGHYGAACELHCENCDGGGCFKNGTCRTGCRQGWRGPQCDQTD